MWVRAILAPSPFVRATVTNFFFCLSLNAFILLPLYIQALGGTEVEIGAIMGLYSAMGILCQPLIGPWVDVIGRRPFMLAGAGLNLAASLLATAPGGVGLLAVVRVLQGLGFSTFFVASFSYVVDIIPPARRGWALGLYGVSGFVATAIAPLIGEWVIRTACESHVRISRCSRRDLCAVVADAGGAAGREHAHHCCRQDHHGPSRVPRRRCSSPCSSAWAPGRSSRSCRPSRRRWG
jgi:MFS family permease